MYKLIAFISTIIRQFYIPNPFEALSDGLIINMGKATIVLSPDLLNWIAEPFMHVITFAVVGLYYDRRSVPALGSFLYLVFYCVHTCILWLMSVVGFSTWMVLTIIVIYVGCHIMLVKLIKCSANI